MTQIRHRIKSAARIAREKAAIAAGGDVPESWRPNRNRRYAARIEAWERACPECGAPPRASCAGKRPGMVRWAFHRARWQPLTSDDPGEP